MSTDGLTRAGLARLHQVLSGHVERQELPGLVALVSRREDVHVEVLGTHTFGQTAPMKRDSIFRIASLTKPITAVAAMMLVEDCRLRLDDPIEPWLPELARRRVLRSLASAPDDTVPAHRPITVRDLLTLRMGFGSIMAPPGTYPIQKLIREYRIGGDAPMLPAEAPPMNEWLRRLGSLPLLAQPGERWMYHVSSDVLGALIARVSGQTLGEFMRARIFDPLGMKDTGFYVPPGAGARLPGCYFLNRDTNRLEPFEDLQHSAWSAAPPFEAGGGGLVSTIDDYFAFCQMMLHQGRYARERLLSPASVALMTTDHLTPAQRADGELFLGTHASWGLGVAVDIGRQEIYHSPGRFGWTGGFGTTAYTDPAQALIGILFTQRTMDSPEPPRVFTDFWTLAYGAIG